MAIKTWDTSRAGGGTYELERDATTGSYSLKSVGFAQVNKLNLPDLISQDKETPPISGIPKQPKVDDPYKKLLKKTQDMGDDTKQDYSGVMLKTPEVKDVSVRDAGEMRKEQIKKAGGVKTSQGQMYVTDAGFQIAEDQANEQRAGMTDANIGHGAFDSQKPDYKTPTMIMKEQEFEKGQYTGLQNIKSDVKKVTQKAKFKFQPIIAIAGKALGGIFKALTPESSPTNKVNKSYFNIRGGSVDGNRIAGNPAEDLYAGMNRTSAFGNLERAGNKRIATREATIARREKQNKPMSPKFKKDTENMKKQAAKYKQAKETAIDTSPGATGGEGGGGDQGSDSNTRVICTYFYSKNQFSLTDLQLDTEFSRNNLSDEVKIGYWFWAIPLVDWMKKHENSNNWWVKLVKNSTKLFAQERAKEIAYTMGKKNKGSLIGKFVRLFGETGCYILGTLIKPFVFDKYKGFLNEYQKDVNLIGKI